MKIRQRIPERCADVSFTDADTTSYARRGQPVVMLDVKKGAGGNIINAIDQLKMVVEDLKTPSE